MHKALKKAKLGYSERDRAVKSLMKVRQRLERENSPEAHLSNLITKERAEAPLYGGRTVFDDKRKKTAGKRKNHDSDVQLQLFR